MTTLTTNDDGAKPVRQSKERELIAELLTTYDSWHDKREKLLVEKERLLQEKLARGFAPVAVMTAIERRLASIDFDLGLVAIAVQHVRGQILSCAD